MTNNETLVSVIVPVYGTEAYLPACIESIQNQSHSNLQIILVDDQSPDRCPEICDDYARKDPRILVVHQENKGVSGARNTGMDHALGEFIMFVDSDDELYPEAVETLLRDAREYGADVTSAIKRVVDEKGQSNTSNEDGRILRCRGEEPLLLSLAGDRNTNSVCAKLFEAELVRNLRFVEGKNINEDGFFLFQCYMKQPVLVQHNVAIYQYNNRTGSSSKQIFSDRYLSMLYFCDRKKELIAIHYPQFSEQVHNMEVRTNLQMLDLLCRTKEKKYRVLQRQCVNRVRRLCAYHKPINRHHRLLSWIVVSGLYPVYKRLVRFKYN